MKMLGRLGLRTTAMSSQSAMIPKIQPHRPESAARSITSKRLAWVKLSRSANARPANHTKTKTRAADPESRSVCLVWACMLPW